MNLVEKKLGHIMLHRGEIDFEKNVHLKEKALLGEEIKIPARELVLIFLDIEKEFDIKIPEKEIVDGNLKTYTRICEMIERLQKVKQINRSK